ncbi:MAG: hypothetical protein HY801_13470 [Candidatus Lindowbacteria bacterium]|nr:hypothetical protein [Candidatus Lindowbacteria bacterium]
MAKVCEGSGFDLEAVEFGLRVAVLAAGASFLERIIGEKFGSARAVGPVVCECGKRMRSVGLRRKKLTVILGRITFKRAAFVCPSCGKRLYPADEQLGIVGTGFSPGTQRLMARMGQRDTFREGRDDLRKLAEIIVTAKDVERVAESTGEAVEAWQRKERAEIMGSEFEREPDKGTPVMYVSYDGTGVPMVEWETRGRKGKQPDGSSETLEAKLGCVFTQTTIDEKGYAVRDDASTSFVGAIESSDKFGNRIYAEALRRGLNRAQKVVVIGDAAKYNWEIAETHFPMATHIVDLYHARQHLCALCASLVPQEGKALVRLKERWERMLDKGQVERILKEARKLMPRSGKRRSLAKKELTYFQNNAHRMHYKKYRAQGLLCGFRRSGSWLQNRHRKKTQAIRHGMDGARSKLNNRSEMLSSLGPHRRVLGATRRLRPLFMSQARTKSGSHKS